MRAYISDDRCGGVRVELSTLHSFFFQRVVDSKLEISLIFFFMKNRTCGKCYNCEKSDLTLLLL